MPRAQTDTYAQRLKDNALTVDETVALARRDVQAALDLLTDARTRLYDNHAAPIARAFDPLVEAVRNMRTVFESGAWRKLWCPETRAGT